MQTAEIELPKKSPNEKDIRTSLATGDASSFDLIWEQFATDLLGFITGIMCLRSDAEDCPQEMFILIACKHTKIARAKNLKAYLFKMARNVALNHLKKERRRQTRDQAAATDWLEFKDHEKPRDEHIYQIENAARDEPTIISQFTRIIQFEEIKKLIEFLIQNGEPSTE